MNIKRVFLIIFWCYNIFVAVPNVAGSVDAIVQKCAKLDETLVLDQYPIK